MVNPVPDRHEFILQARLSNDFQHPLLKSFLSHLPFVIIMSEMGQFVELVKVRIRGCDDKVLKINVAIDLLN
ncbi:hypothetical protein D3C78_830130 [compost metagenome]